MELIVGSETSAISFVKPGNYPKEYILQKHIFINVMLALQHQKINFALETIAYFSLTVPISIKINVFGNNKLLLLICSPLKV